MNAKAMIPLIDIVFLSLGSLLGVMSQMELIEGIDVEISEVGPGGAAAQTGEFQVVSIGTAGLLLDDQLVTRDQLAAQLTGGRVILRAERGLPTQQTLELLAELSRLCDEVAIEVEEVVVK
jgi:biopolymer transport protein ExbD